MKVIVITMFLFSINILYSQTQTKVINLEKDMTIQEISQTQNYVTIKMGLSAEVLVGYGFGSKTKPSTSNESLQPYNLGVGVHISYTFENHVDIGATAIFHKGESVNAHTTGQEPGEYSEPRSFTLLTRIQYYGIEVGYSFPINHFFTIRPYGGIGIGDYGGDYFPEGGSFGDVEAVDFGSKPYIVPGISMFSRLGERMFAGIDFRYTYFVFYQRADAFATFVIFGVNI